MSSFLSAQHSANETQLTGSTLIKSAFLIKELLQLICYRSINVWNSLQFNPYFAIDCKTTQTTGYSLKQRCYIGLGKLKS